MGRMYTCPIPGISIGTGSANDDIIKITAASTHPLLIHQIQLNSDQTTAESLDMRILRRTTGGSGGTAQTEVPLDSTSAAVTAAVETLVTTPGTAGAILHHFSWEQLGPWDYLPTPACQIRVAPSAILCLELLTAPAATQQLDGFITWEEL